MYIYICRWPLVLAAPVYQLRCIYMPAPVYQLRCIYMRDITQLICDPTFGRLVGGV